MDWVIKDLEWKEEDESDGYHTANSVTGHYYIYENRDKDTGIIYGFEIDNYRGESDVLTEIKVDTVEQAKKEANINHKERISEFLILK